MNVARSLLFTTSQLKGEGQLISQTLKFELVLTQTDIFKLKRAIDLMAPKVATGKKKHSSRSTDTCCKVNYWWRIPIFVIVLLFKHVIIPNINGSAHAKSVY